MNKYILNPSEGWSCESIHSSIHLSVNSFSENLFIRLCWNFVQWQKSRKEEEVEVDFLEKNILVLKQWKVFLQFLENFVILSRGNLNLKSLQLVVFQYKSYIWENCDSKVICQMFLSNQIATFFDHQYPLKK